MHQAVHSCFRVKRGERRGPFYYVAALDEDPATGERVYWWPTVDGDDESDHYSDSPYEFDHEADADACARQLFGEPLLARFFRLCLRLAGG